MLGRFKIGFLHLGSGGEASFDPWRTNRGALVEALHRGTRASPAQVIHTPHGDKKVRFLLHDRHNRTDAP